MNRLSLYGTLLLATLSASATPSPKITLTGKDIAAITWDYQVVEENYLYLAALADVSKADLTKMHQRMKDLPFGQKEFRFSLMDNEVYVNGRHTGWVYESYSPVKMSINGHKWAYDDKKSFTENYTALRELITPPKKAGKSAALIGIFLNEAHAQTWWDYMLDDTTIVAEAGAVAGAGVGAIAGGVKLGGASLVPTLLMGAGGAGAGAGAGGAIGLTAGVIIGGIETSWRLWKNQTGGIPRASIVDVLMHSNPKISCSDKMMKLSSPDGKPFPNITVDKTTSPYAISVFDLSKTDIFKIELFNKKLHVKKPYVKEPEVKAINLIAQNCNSDADAQGIEGYLQGKAKFVTSIVGTDPGGEKIDSTPGGQVPALKE